MSSEAKKKKSIVKKILLGLGIFFFVIIGALVAIPFFFKDKIKDLALEEASKMLKVEVAVQDFDLTIFSTFPKIKVQFDGVVLTGKEEFDGLKLMDLGSLEAKVDFWSVINLEDISVRSVRLIQPHIHVKVLPDGTANYDIVKSEEELKEEEEETESSAFKFSLEHYEIVEGNIIYDDRASNMYAQLVNLNHSGTGDMTADVIDFKTLTSMDELSFTMDNIAYLNKVKTDLQADLLMEFQEKSSKFTLKENELKLNALNLSFDGFYEMFADYSDLDFKLNADKISFKELLSLVPAFYHTGYEGMIADGSMDLNAFLKGRMDDKALPAWDVNLNVQNASITYPDMPANIKNIEINAGSQFPGGENLDLMTIDVPVLKASFVGNTIDANFFMKNPMTDPFMKAKLDAKVDLATIDQVYPMEGDKYVGKLTSDLEFEGRMSAIEQEKYDQLKASGTLLLNDFVYQSEDLPEEVEINNLKFEFSPHRLELADLTAKMGESDFKMNGEVKNYMEYIFKDENLEGTFNFTSNYINVDQIMPPSSEEVVEIEEEIVVEGEAEAIKVPKNIDFTLNTAIAKINYDGLVIDNVKGQVALKDEVANLSDLSMNAMGGNILLNGKYDTKDKERPQVDFAYSLKQLDIKQLVDNFLSIEKIAPITKHITGSISSDFTMNTELTPSMDLVLNSLNGEGSFLTGDIVIVDLKILEKLGDALKMENIKQQTLKNVKATFEFADGKMNVKPFDVKLGKINTNVSGFTTLEQEIDYQLKMDIPRDQIPSQMMDIAEKAIAQAKKIPFFEMKELPANIPVTAYVTNTITDPKISVNLKEKLMELGGNVKDNIKDFIDEKKEELKDTIKKVIDEKIDEAKEELEKQKQKILAEAQKQADNIVTEAKKLADKTRAEANKNAQKLIDEAGSNILKKKAAEVAAQKLRDEGEKSAKKIESEAQKQADDIMKKAREKADNLY